MKRVDFIGQSLIMGTTLIFVVLNLRNYPVIPIIAGAAVLGPWQVVSSLLSVIFRTEFHRLKRVHLFTSIGYLIYLPIMEPHQDLISNEFMLTSFFGIPALLAVFYYTLTCNWLLEKNQPIAS